MTIKLHKMPRLSPVNDRPLKSFMWRWSVSEGNAVLAGGFCATKRDARNDAQLYARHSA